MRRPLGLFLDLLLIVLGVLSGLAMNYVTNQQVAQPALLTWVQRHSLLLLGGALVLSVVGRAILYRLDRPPPRRRVWSRDRPPFPGLAAFTADDAGVFFGRDQEIGELLDRLHPRSHHADRFVAVVGSSGSGKSSLVQAGVLPQLTRRRASWVVVGPFTPQDDPFRHLARSLVGHLLDIDVPATAAALRDDGAGALRQMIERVRDQAGGRHPRILIVVDQAEELMTLVGDQDQRAFMELLRGVVEDNSGAYVLITLRSEFLTPLLELGYADLLRNPVVIGAMSRAGLRLVIERPAAEAGLSFEPAVVDRLIEETETGDALPLLAYTLQLLWEGGKDFMTVTEAGYAAVGGVAGVIERQAGIVTEELSDQDAVVGALLKLVTVTETGQPTRRRVPLVQLSADEKRIAQAFLDARLLSTDGRTVEVAHEALLRQWPPLRQAIEVCADDLRRRAELERWALDWDTHDRPASYLLRDDRLKSAQDWLTANPDFAQEAPLAYEFIRMSMRSNRAALERASEAVARRAIADLDRDPDRGLLLALAALEECAVTPIARRALVTALARSRTQAVLRHDDVVRTIAWSPDGGSVVTGDHTGTLGVWDAVTGRPQRALSAGAGWIRSVDWSPDGRWIAAGTEDGGATVRHATTLAVVACLVGHDEPVHEVRWSPDSRLVATVSHDRTLRVWDAATGRPVCAPAVHEAWVRSVSWSPDGQRLVTGAVDGRIRVWNRDGHVDREFEGHEDWVDAVAWSPDGSLLASGSSDQTVRIWEAASGRTNRELHGHTDWVQAVAWSPDGQQLATVSRDRTARVWSLSHPSAEPLVLLGHTRWIHDVRWSPGDGRLATASYDGTARIWSLDSGSERCVLRGHGDRVISATVSPDGSTIATASADGSVLLWDAHTAQMLRTLSAATDAFDVAWSPDGRHLAAVTRDLVCRIWDATSGACGGEFAGHQNWPEYVAWCPDGTRLVTGSNDHTAIIWNVHSGASERTLLGHGNWVRGVSWCPRGDRIATASYDRTARIWDAATGASIAVLSGHEDCLEDVDWAPDGNLLATASHDGTVRIWEPGGACVRILRGHEDEVQSVAWSPDRRRLASGSSDGTARLWDAETGEEVAVVAVHDAVIDGVAWLPDGLELVTAARDCTARVWTADLSVAGLLERARQRMVRKLSVEERRSVGLPEQAPDQPA